MHRGETLAGLSIYKRNQGQITRSVTAVVLAVFVAALCYFVNQKLVVHVPAGGEQYEFVNDVNESWAISRPWPDKQSPEYAAGTVVTDEVKERMRQTVSRGEPKPKWYFKAARPFAYAIHIQLGVPVLLLVVGAAGIFRLVNGPKFADFLIATESEMKKVHWSSRAELIGSTIVVIVTVLILAAYIFGVDSMIIKGLSLLRVLPS